MKERKLCLKWHFFFLWQYLLCHSCHTSVFVTVWLGHPPSVDFHCVGIVSSNISITLWALMWGMKQELGLLIEGIRNSKTIKRNFKFFNKLGILPKKNSRDKQTNCSLGPKTQPPFTITLCPCIVYLYVIPEIHSQRRLLTTIFIAIKWRLCYVEQCRPFSPSPILLNIKH